MMQLRLALTGIFFLIFQIESQAKEFHTADYRCEAIAHVSGTSGRHYGVMMVNAWLAGFFSAINASLQMDGTPTFDLNAFKDNPNIMYDRVIDWCREHPSSNISSAAVALLKTFTRQ